MGLLDFAPFFSTFLFDLLFFFSFFIFSSATNTPLFMIINLREINLPEAFEITGGAGIEPAAYGFGDRRSTNWANPLHVVKYT